MRKLIIGSIILFAGLMVYFVVFVIQDKTKENHVIEFITNLYTVSYEQSSEFFKKLEVEIEEETNNKKQEQLVTFDSKVIEQVALEIKPYLTDEAYELLLRNRTLTSLYQLSKYNKSNLEVSNIRKVNAIEKEDRFEFVYSFNLEQFDHLSNNKISNSLVEIKVYVVKVENEWKISYIHIVNDTYLDPLVDSSSTE